MHCLIGGSAQTKVVSWFKLVAPPSGKKNLCTKFGPASVVKSNDTIRRAFARVPSDIHIRHEDRRKKEATSCGSPLKEMSTEYGIFDGVPGPGSQRALRCTVNIIFIVVMGRPEGVHGCSDDACGDDCRLLPVVDVNQRTV